MSILLVCFLELLSKFSIVLITGCSLGTARQWMNNLPGVLPIPLYKHQAQRLVRELTKIQVLANVIFIGQGSSST
ncbi:hypothetical protein FM036_17365 [Nostoc sp. HG1]|nr:hypothetical protein [Nostoc sp. HG1]